MDTSKYWRWGLLHPEHMVPGSFWQIKDVTALYYLEDFRDVEAYLCRNLIWSSNAYSYASLTFELDKLYFLVRIEEKANKYNVTFLCDTDIIKVRITKGCWDSIFELAKGSNNPKFERKLFLGRIPFEELKSKLGK